MTRALIIIAASLGAACISSSERDDFPPDGALVDLSHAYDEQTIFWPTADPFRLQKVADGITEGGYYYAANSFFTSEHGGTHLDAPLHFAQGHPSVAEIPLDRLVGRAVVIDVTEPSARNADYLVSVQDIERAEQADGIIPPGAIVLIRTGFSRRWPDAGTYLGTAARGPDAVKGLHFPGLHPDAAAWLIANRSIKAVGIDTASIDYGQSTQYESHRALFERDVPAFENLTALERLPARGASVIALPMKIGGGSGAPLRAIAILPGG
jgi:kynurenine formamidase